MMIDGRWWVFATLVAVGCSNAGEDRVLAIDAEGVLAGLVYFDGDGSRSISGGDGHGRGNSLATRLRRASMVPAPPLPSRRPWLSPAGQPAGTCTQCRWDARG